MVESDRPPGVCEIRPRGTNKQAGVAPLSAPGHRLAGTLHALNLPFPPPAVPPRRAHLSVVK